MLDVDVPIPEETEHELLPDNPAGRHVDPGPGHFAGTHEVDEPLGHRFASELD